MKEYWEKPTLSPPPPSPSNSGHSDLRNPSRVSLVAVEGGGL